MYEEDLPCAVLQSKCDSSDSSDQRSQRVSLSQKKLDDKTQLKTSTDRAFCVKLSNAFSALDGEAVPDEVICLSLGLHFFVYIYNLCKRTASMLK